MPSAIVDESGECVGANAVDDSFQVVGGGRFFFEKQDEEEKLFTRRLFSNFDRTTMLLSPSFKAIVELYRFFTVSYCGRTPFFRNGKKTPFCSQSFMLLFAMI